VGKGVVYVVSHELETATPVVDVEVCVAEPGVSITGAAAPFGLGHVVVEMDVDLLLCELGGNGIIHLFCASVKKFTRLYTWTYLESGGRSTELWVVLNYVLIRRVSIASQCFLERLLYRHISAAILDVINHLDCEREPNMVHVQALDFRHNGLDRLVL
jgi:hypothetical protein